MASKKDSLMNIVVCGSGNASHVLAGLVASRKNTSLTILTLDTEEAEQWSKTAKESEFILSAYDAEMTMTDTKVKIKIVTSDAERALKKAEMIIFTVATEQHQQYLEAISPYLEANMSIVGMPGLPGFEFQCYDVLKEKAKHCCIMNVNTQPWAGRIIEFGKSVKILSREECVVMTAIRGTSKNGRDPVQLLQYIFGEFPELKLFNNFIESTLSIKTILNPVIMYSKWVKWDEKPVSKKPLFYQELTEEGAKLISEVSDEIVLTAREITKQKPNVVLENVIHIFDTLKEEYKYNIDDDSTLLQVIKTNTAFGSYQHPMEEVAEGLFNPDFTHRFITEDVPFGLVILKGISQLAKMKTPILDKVITWCQEKMGKEYICGSKLVGKDLSETRAPQQHGIKSLDDLVQMIEEP